MPDKLHTFISWPAKQKLLFFEAVLTQYLTWILLLFIPFKNIPKLFSNPKIKTINPDKNLIEQIRLATAYANTLSFWKNKCLVQSLAARLMLRRRRIESLLTIGVTHSFQKKVAAHAWLVVGDFELVAKSGDYHELFSF